MSLSLQDTLAALPPEHPDSLSREIRERHLADQRTVVVLDDDPTGTQTVYDTPVMTEWSEESLCREFQAAPPLLYLLTNSRGFDAGRANALAEEIGQRLKAASAATGRSFSVVSRSDSTLRGHFPSEVDALAGVLGLSDAPRLLVPFFAEGGRYTIDDVHYVAEGERLVPVAETPFARDASFGYKHSNLREWVEEKTQGGLTADQVRSLGLDLLRGGDLNPIVRWLEELPDGSVGVVNAASPRDLEVFVTALMPVERAGRVFLFRTAASFVQARVGLPSRPLLSGAALVGDREAGGLILVGSYVPKTTAQLRALLEKAGSRLESIELDVRALLGGGQELISQATERVNSLLAGGRDVVISTSREVITGGDSEASLGIGQTVSRSLVQLARGLATKPAYVLAKGGITSSDVATGGLGVRRAMVRGQLLPAVPVWELGRESRFPGLSYVVFPGNVGGDGALADAWMSLSASRGT